MLLGELFYWDFKLQIKGLLEEQLKSTERVLYQSQAEMFHIELYFTLAIQTDSEDKTAREVSGPYWSNWVIRYRINPQQ